MPHPAAFQLESLSYQNDAVESVVRVFEGTPKPAAADVEGNRCPLTWAQISANLQAIAQRHRISDERLNLTAPAQGQALDVCVEMETGTGKTLVYLRTIYRLQADYGWNKFIIVVPTVVIRAGVMGSLTDFGAQLAQQNGLNHPIPSFEYDSSRLQQLKTFIDSPTPAIMVMNSQAFVGQGKIISNEEDEAPLDGLTWLQALARCRPVVVMDEPQMGMDTDAALKAFDDMKPLAKLRYSATHSKGQARNCVYRLTPAQAYEPHHQLFHPGCPCGSAGQQVRPKDRPDRWCALGRTHDRAQPGRVGGTKLCAQALGLGFLWGGVKRFF